MQHSYVFITGSPAQRPTHSHLQIEKRQTIDEGKRFEAVEDEYESLLEDLRTDPAAHQDEVHEFLDRTRNLPIREDFPYHEPNGFTAIRDARPEGPRTLEVSDDEDELFDAVLGAWLGRCAGCLLGKPTEGWTSDQMWGYLQELDRYPLDDYFRSDVPEHIVEEYELEEYGAFINEVDHMPRDDDIDYTVTGLGVVKNNGIDFDSEDIAEFWLHNFPALNTYTAERVAYRNLLNMVDPPESARRYNPYREGIGAQIRADFYGYVSIGNPERAAELAWRDARISHVKNGIYGEMWVAAMLAAAPGLEDPEEIIRVGLSEIPAESRLTEAIEDVISWYHGDVDYEDAVNRVHNRWDEDIDELYGWLHTISNAQVVAIGLLYGEGKYEQSICRAVQACFDTDCNGATVGSILGMLYGADALPEKWIKPLNDTVETSLVNYPLENISDLAQQGFELYIQTNT